MGARTPDAYRIGAGQVAQEYPADVVPVRLSKQPSLPTMSRAPQAPPVEQVVTAEVAVVRRTAGVSPRQSKEARLSKEPAAVAQRNIVVRDAVPVQAAPVVESPAPAREYAHLDAAGVAFGGDQRPGVPVHHDWRRATMCIVNPAGEQVSHKRGVSAPALPVPTQFEEASGVGGASRAQRATRRAGVGASRMDRRERPARRGQHYRGLLMFLLGFISALLVVAAVVGGRFFARSTAASGFANAVDSCHARGLHARLASDETSLTLEAFSDSGDSLTTPIFQCVLGKLGTPAAAGERMHATRAIDGTQSEEWGSYKATWTYEPDQGLTVIVSSR